jgi:hypothetical protein
VIVDFAFLRSVIPLRRVTVFIQDATQPGVSFGTALIDIQPREGPFTLEFPFASFGVRGGGPGTPDLRRSIRFSLGISPTRFDDVEEINFSTAIERLRFGRAVPEPLTSILVCSGIFGLIWIRVAAVTSEAGPQPTFAEPQPPFAPTNSNDESMPAPGSFPPGLPVPLQTF